MLGLTSRINCLCILQRPFIDEWWASLGFKPPTSLLQQYTVNLRNTLMWCSGLYEYTVPTFQELTKSPTQNKSPVIRDNTQEIHIGQSDYEKKMKYKKMKS